MHLYFLRLYFRIAVVCFRTEKHVIDFLLLFFGTLRNEHQYVLFLRIRDMISCTTCRLCCRNFPCQNIFNNLVSEIFDHAVYCASFINTQTFNQVLIVGLRSIPTLLVAEYKNNVTGSAGISGWRCIQASLSIQKFS